MASKSFPIAKPLSMEAFDAFLEAYQTDEFKEQVREASGWSQAEVERQLAVYFNEMRHGFSFVAQRIGPNDKSVLEVGAGLGFLSLFLAKNGYSVTALEPGAQGFPLFRTSIGLSRDIAEREGIDVRFLDIGAEELAEHGIDQIDFAFSINVVEHIERLDGAFESVIGSLARRGRWCNYCPNYAVPYEPHFAIPMVPFSPALTRRLFRKTIETDLPLWHSLNFVTARKVSNLSRRFGAQAVFEKDVLWDTLNRMTQDDEFAARHQNSIAGMVFKLLVETRLLGLVKYVPPSISTPMQFTIERHPKNAPDA